MPRNRKSPVIASEPGTGPRGPFPELSTLPSDESDPRGPSAGDISDEDLLKDFQEEAGDNALLVKLGDCRKCQQNLGANAELILVNALKYSYSALADNINRSIPIESAVARNIPINGPQMIELLLRLSNLGVPQSVTNVGPLAGLVWFPDMFQNPDKDPPINELWRGRASPAEIGAYFMTATAHAYKLWVRSKVNQKECCKKHVLPQNPYRKRVTVWLGMTKKKVTI